MRKEVAKVSAIIVNYNGVDDSIECLKSVLNISYPENLLEVIFVDNNSTDNSAATIKKKFSGRVKVIKLPINAGYAGGVNVAVKQAKGDYLLILNNDLVLARDCLSQLVKTALRSGRYAVVGPKVYDYKQSLRSSTSSAGLKQSLRSSTSSAGLKQSFSSNKNKKIIQTLFGKIDRETMHVARIGSGETDRGQYDKEKESEYVAFCCALVKKEALFDIGLLDENFCVYYEEVDFYLRLLKKNWKIVFCPWAKVWHKGATSTGDKPFLVTYYLSRNSLYIRNKFKKFSLINHIQNIRFLVTSAVIGVVKPEYRAIVIGIKDFYLNRLGSASFFKE